MGAVLEKRKLSVNSEYGEAANEEIILRMKAAQQNWLSYRNEYCTVSYYTKAPSHSASDDMSAVMCKIKKTQERIDEINEYNGSGT